MDDDFTQKQEKLRRRLQSSLYPWRDDAVFTDENDHNPLVLEACPACSKWGRCGPPEPCPECHGLKTTGRAVHYFPNPLPEEAAVVDEQGWITCPLCDRRFSTRYRGTWTGRRHLTCGQAIRLVHP